MLIKFSVEQSVLEFNVHIRFVSCIVNYHSVWITASSWMQWWNELWAVSKHPPTCLLLHFHHLHPLMFNSLTLIQPHRALKVLSVCWSTAVKKHLSAAMMFQGRPETQKARTWSSVFNGRVKNQADHDLLHTYTVLFQFETQNNLRPDERFRNNLQCKQEADSLLQVPESVQRNRKVGKSSHIIWFIYKY